MTTATQRIIPKGLDTYEDVEAFEGGVRAVLDEILKHYEDRHDGLKAVNTILGVLVSEFVAELGIVENDATAPARWLKLVGEEILRGLVDAGMLPPDAVNRMHSTAQLAVALSHAIRKSQSSRVRDIGVEELEESPQGTQPTADQLRELELRMATKPPRES